jgi:O-antigen/teichoic acid export membrane protein
MIKSIQDIIKGFLSRDGGSIFYAMILARIISFLSSWLVYQLVNPTDLGNVLYLQSFLVFIIPIAGYGLNHSYIRYAALSSKETDKSVLFLYSLKSGIGINFINILLFIGIGYVLGINSGEKFTYLVILSFSLFSFYLLDLVKNYFRIKHENKRFAYLEIVNNILLISLVGILSYYWGAAGYAVAIVTAPLLAVLVFIPKINLKIGHDILFPFDKKSYYHYGFFASLAGVATQLLFAIDMILLGNITGNPEVVTQFKYVSLIPFSLLFLPSILITADFVKLTENIGQKKMLQTYIGNYTKLFILLSIAMLLVGFLLSKPLLVFFSKDLAQYTTAFRILLVGVVGVFMWRGLYGNLLSSIGKAYVNFWISTSAFIINVILNLLFIPRYGITGAAFTSAITMWISGVLSYFLFHKYWKKL